MGFCKKPAYACMGSDRGFIYTMFGLGASLKKIARFNPVLSAGRGAG